jgi:hypothetical protein
MKHLILQSIQKGLHNFSKFPFSVPRAAGRIFVLEVNCILGWTKVSSIIAPKFLLFANIRFSIRLLALVGAQLEQAHGGKPALISRLRSLMYDGLSTEVGTYPSLDVKRPTSNIK